MNLEITEKERQLLLDGTHVRIKNVEKLIETFTDIKLISIYVNDRTELIDLQKKLLSL